MSVSVHDSVSRTRRDGLLVGLVMLAALLVRLPGHLDSGLWYDEIWSLTDSGRATLGGLLTHYPGDNHHPLHDLLGWLALRAFGESAWAWRLPALVAGALSVGMLLVYARRVTRASEAWLATALAATSFHHVWFSQNARGYTLLLLLALASAQLWERLDAGLGDRRTVAGYAAVVALAVYTHPTAVVLPAGQLTASLGRRAWGDGSRAPRGGGAVVAGVALAAALAVVLYAPKLPELASYHWEKATGDAAGIEAVANAPTAWTSLGWPIAAAARSFGLGLAAGLVALAGIVTVLVAGAVSYAREAPARLVAWTAPGALLAIALVALGRNLWPRLLFFLAGFALLVLARGSRVLVEAATPRRLAGERVTRSALAAIWLASTALLPRAYALPKQDFEGARADLAARRAPGESVATVGLAKLPYERFYASDYVAIDDVEALDALARRSRGVYVISTIPDFLASRRPDLAAAIAERGHEVARYRGSVGDGDVVIYRLSPLPAGDEP